MLTVAIPVQNEAANVGSIVRFAKAHPSVREVIVVDDGSIDDTVRLASEAGANVITSSMLGKGPSMRDALDIARTELILYLDGNIRRPDPSLIDRMLAPFERNADFVKANFSGASGRVTELVARPLLRTFFPGLSRFSQPLGGIVAARTGLLRKLEYEDDLGVDVGLLVDAHCSGALVAEVNLGTVEHDSKPLTGLGRAAIEIGQAILRRAESVGRLPADRLAETVEHLRRLGASLDNLAQNIEPGGKLALFSMDDTLLDGCFIRALARRAGFETALTSLLGKQTRGVARSASVAALFEGIPEQTFVEVAKSMPLQPGAVEAITELRRLGYRVGVVSDSYHVAAETVRKRVFADFAIGHALGFANGHATGELTISELFRHSAGCGSHGICKRNVLAYLADFADQPFGHTLMVGSGENDVCLAKAVDAGFACQPKSPLLQAESRPLIDLREIPRVVSREIPLI
ncbi:glycosyltransferase [Chitinimonas koreensis]|uniref:glycosyltransferase n=1 Tax=Chitinimonas koreensis TaxID=356302 RepID=UPI000416F060|nr:glycosyltransferase [Chitinimonas koreensis]QNM98696.1 glycosyltransferase [Chitinimonas koreensis]